MTDDGDVKVIKIVLQLTFEKESGTMPHMVMKDLEALRDVIVANLKEDLAYLNVLTPDRAMPKEKIQRLWDLWLKWLGDVECQNIRELS